MYIAKRLKEENIAKYVLYLWQVEDLLRANHLDMDELRTNYLAAFKAEGKAEKELEEWYEGLIRMMREEGVRESGHLQINKNTVAWLTELHNRLLHSSKYPFYSAAYYKVLPYIVEIRHKGDRQDVSEVENCLDILYGVMMLRLQKRPVGEETARAAADIAKLLGMLSDYYKQDKAGTLEF